MRADRRVSGSQPNEDADRRVGGRPIAWLIAFLGATAVELALVVFAAPRLPPGVFEPEITVQALSAHGVLALLLAGFDVALLAVMSVLARRCGRWLLAIPVVVVVATTLAYAFVLQLTEVRQVVGGLGWEAPVPSTHGAWLPLVLLDLALASLAVWLWRTSRQSGS